MAMGVAKKEGLEKWLAALPGLYDKCSSDRWLKTKVSVVFLLAGFFNPLCWMIGCVLYIVGLVDLFRKESTSSSDLTNIACILVIASLISPIFLFLGLLLLVGGIRGAAREDWCAGRQKKRPRAAIP